MKQLLIVGIDPGTTVGYAVIDVSGAVVTTRAAKELTLDTVVQELSALGTVLIVATDKAKVPSFVASVATKLGAKLCVPAEDLLIVEKRALVSTYTSAQTPQSHHSLDALAAARIAFKKHERLFQRIDSFLENNNKRELNTAMKELVVKQGISIKAAFDFLTSPEKPEVQALQRTMSGRTRKPEQYWQLYDALSIARGEKELLQQQNKKLMNLAKKLKKKNSALRNKVRPETRIIRPTAELEQAQQTIRALQQRLEQTLVRQQRLQQVLLNPEKYVVAKKLRNLGFDEYKRVSRVLGFTQGDVLFVEDANAVSERTINGLAGLVDIAVSIMPIQQKTAEQLPFTVLAATGIPHTQDEYFAFLDRQAFQKARADKELLRKLIEEYQQSRHVLG